MMRVELIYHPGNDVYKSIHKVLEDVIAEERWPIPVEMVEDKVHSRFPSIRVDGQIVNKKDARHTFDYLKELLGKKWAELTHMRKAL
jgi:hypothetical protein